MKAAVINQFGDTDVLKFEDISVPSPKPGHILIKVLAAGTNRLEHYLREGSVVPEFPFPHILGADAAGEVARLGQGVEGFDIGERVIPMPGFPTDEQDYDIYPASLAPSFTLLGLGIWGTYAQYIEVPARFTLKDDTGLSAEEVATLPMALATAVRAVKEIGNVEAGDKVLVQAGASGSGSMQVQVAKALGAEVVTTVRDDAKGEFAKSIGADLVINTRNEDLVGKVMAWTDGRGVDVAIDNVGGDVLAKSIDAVKATGVVVAFGFTAGTEVTFDIRNFFFGQKQLRGSMGSDMKDLQWGLEQVKTGKIKPVLDRVLPLSQAAEAHYLIANNRVSGNIVLQPWSE
ncbi:MAG: zinc-binding dehydrogenase [Gammaproteobacteria bacterium]|nr:zinc-binding dehydrogenase [Gammaproteobacteria bacterium]